MRKETNMEELNNMISFLKNIIKENNYKEVNKEIKSFMKKIKI